MKAQRTDNSMSWLKKRDAKETPKKMTVAAKIKRAEELAAKVAEWQAQGNEITVFEGCPIDPVFKTQPANERGRY